MYEAGKSNDVRYETFCIIGMFLTDPMQLVCIT
jgi:hypothetical protein